MQVQITIDRVEFLKPYRFFLLVKTPNATKRTEIAQYSETPNFANKTILLGQPDSVQVSACIVLDYTGRLDQTGQTLVFGRCDIPKEEYMLEIEAGGIYQRQKEFVQETKAGRLVVGHFKATINQRKDDKVSEYVEDIQEFRMEEAPEESSKVSDKYSTEPKVRIDLHCGTDFPGDSGFFLQVGWSEKYRSANPKYLQTSRMVQHDINPLWREQLVLPLTKSMRTGFLVLLLRDKDNSILEQVSFEVVKLQPFFHYHVELVASSQVKHAHPRVFFSLVMETIPEKNLTEEICQLAVTGVEMLPEVQANKRFVLGLSSTPDQSLTFSKLVVSKDGLSESNLVEHCRKNCQNFFLSPVLVSPIQPVSEPEGAETVCRLHLLKSSLLRQNFLVLFELPTKQKMPSSIVSPVMASANCTSILRQVFYQEERQAVLLEPTELGKKTLGELKCLVEFGSEAAPNQSTEMVHQPLKVTDPTYQRWKVLSNDAKLKQQLIHSMRKEIEQRTSNITKKGDGIEALRRAQHNLSARHRFLQRKWEEEQSIRVSASDEKVNIHDLHSSLISTAEQLQQLIASNEQAMVRLQAADAVDQPELNTAKFEQEYSRNRPLIQEMSERIAKVPFYTQIVCKQKQSILKLQKLFEKSQIDNQMNQILNKSLKELEGKKPRKVLSANLDQRKLTKILEHIDQQKVHKLGPQAERLAQLQREIAATEDELRRKSEYYARLVFRSDF